MMAQGGHNRHSIRLKEYDYSRPGFYFVTICIKNKVCVLGKIIEEINPADGVKIILSDLGKIVKNVWLSIPQYYKIVELDEFVIMPNHIHGIIAINENDTDIGAIHENNIGAGLAPAQLIKPGTTARVAPTLGNVIGSFKSRCTNEWLKYIEQNNIDEIGKFWQRNYYERIIRNEKELNKIRNYIINNSLRWYDDPENPYKNSKK